MEKMNRRSGKSDSDFAQMLLNCDKRIAIIQKDLTSLSLELGRIASQKLKQSEMTQHCVETNQKLRGQVAQHLDNQDGTSPEIHNRRTYTMDIPALPFVSIVLKAKRPLNPAYPKALVTIGDHIRKRRLDLGLRQKDVAATVGVAITTVTSWEVNRAAPTLSVLPQIIAFLGYVPSPYDKAGDDIVEKIKLYRLTNGLSQKKLSKQIGVNATTIAQWERREHMPSKILIRKLSTLNLK